MIVLINELKKYLLDTIGVQIKTERWRDEKLLLDSYNIYDVVILGLKCLIVLVKDTNEQTPGTIKKHIHMIHSLSEASPIYVHPSISAYNRKRLIEHKVAFITPGNQMYLPWLGIDLREHIRKIFNEKIDKFSPSTQAVVF